MDQGQSGGTSVMMVTVTYRAAEFIERYLLSVKDIFEQDARFKLTIVDNASPDNTLEVVGRFIDEHNLSERMTLVDAGVNGGFGFGCNLGAKQRTSEEFIWFVNPDTQVELSSAIALIDKLNTDKDLAAAGSMLKNERGEVRSGAFRFPTMGNALVSGINLGALEKLLPNNNTSYAPGESLENIDWLTGASFMIRAEVFESVGGFDEGYFLYFEEVDLFYRLRKAGYRVAGCETSVVFHASGSSTGVNRHDVGYVHPRRPKYWYESRCRFYLKHFGRVYLMAINIVHALSTVAGRIKDGLLRRKANRVQFYLRDILKHSFYVPEKPLTNIR